MWSSILYDWILASQEAIDTLQWWLGLLEDWQQAGGASIEEFNAAYLQLQDAGLEDWAAIAAGHGITALATAVLPSNDCAQEDVYTRTEFSMIDEAMTQCEAFSSSVYRR